MPAKSQRGLSLLEMLVVLVISGMALLLTSQAIGQYQRAQASVLHSERSGREYRLSEAWWRDAVRGIQAPPEGPLEGDSKGFTATTLSPLLGATGTPVEQLWQTAFAEDGGWALAVTEGSEQVVLVFRENSEVQFRYLDAQGEFHDRWPPILGEHAPLPEAIAAVWSGDEASSDGRTLIANIAGAKRTYYRPYEREVDL